MTTDNWFAAICFLAVYVMCLILLDGAHRAHISALKATQREQVAGLRTYIRTLSRERLYLEAEVQRLGDKLKAEQERVKVQAEVRWMPEHIEWLPPSAEYNEDADEGEWR